MSSMHTGCRVICLGLKNAFMHVHLLQSLPPSLSLSLSLPPSSTQYDATRKHMLELERSHGDLETANAQRRVTISQLEQRLEDREMDSGLVDELREQVDALEEQLARLQTQVHAYCACN